MGRWGSLAASNRITQRAVKLAGGWKKLFRSKAVQDQASTPWVKACPHEVQVGTHPSPHAASGSMRHRLHCRCRQHVSSLLLAQGCGHHSCWNLLPVLVCTQVFTNMLRWGGSLPACMGAAAWSRHVLCTLVAFCGACRSAAGSGCNCRRAAARLACYILRAVPATTSAPPCRQAMVGEIVQHAGSGSKGMPGGVVFLLDGSGSVTEGETICLQHLSCIPTEQCYLAPDFAEVCTRG